ncbi:uncharacterized protein F5Z01DRAFT_676002 [Emericellopsis atlantica]|uniref:Siderophore biosynthesis n=1 Tax=Emericellopsis atlantica TaxID=2614577 RepID=A0A9P8CMA8_9HYPO|nr:uncharacterized protein F5Z01DRAFT_676002 [Emericellopsis atlantica]KAG9252524.1 hypothetical protein F5Z01DRAFT_676002 [Emericellopsis atlantica]
MKYTTAALALAASVYAKTDLDGCTSFTSWVTVRPEPGYGNTYQSIVWYVPDSLEICQFVDCGGGRAPPKSVPGCPLYQGTETVTPSFLASDPMKTEEPKTVATATAPEASSTAIVEETRSVATATAPDLSSSAATSAMVTVTTTSAVVSTVTETPATTAGPGGDGEEDGGAEETSTDTSTDTPGAAMPTAMVGLNMLAGAAAAAFLL